MNFFMGPSYLKPLTKKFFYKTENFRFNIEQVFNEKTLIFFYILFFYQKSYSNENIIFVDFKLNESNIKKSINNEINDLITKNKELKYKKQV